MTIHVYADILQQMRREIAESARRRLHHVLNLGYE